MIERYLDAGININAFDDFGRTPLMWASALGQLENVRLLIAAGAHLDPITELAAINRKGQHAFLLAASAGSLDVSKELAQHILGKGMDLQLTDANGWNALHYACAAGSVDLAGWLIEQGFPVNGRTRHDTTALMLACKNRQERCMLYLIESGADLDAQDHLGLTALHWCAHVGAHGLAKHLIDAGCRTDIPDQLGVTAIEQIEQAGNTRSAEPPGSHPAGQRSRSWIRPLRRSTHSHSTRG